MKNFKSPKPMLDWQYRSMLEELNELQRHASDPSCPCVLSDSGEFCLHKHSLGLHTLAKETASMDAPNKGLLETLADEALTQHNALKDRITCGKQHKDEKDTVAWSRQWRKKLEGIYYHAGCPIATHKVSDPGHVLTADNVANHMHFPANTEEVKAAFVGPSHEVLAVHTVSTGGHHSAPLPVDKIVREAKQVGASGIVLAHNHPSGSLDASKDDRDATIALGQAAKKEGIELVDHVVVGGEHRHSTFKEKGLRVASPIRQEVIFFNPKNGNKKELLTLIDTGAEPSGLPLEVIEELDLSEWGTTTINLATGEERPNTKLYLAGATLLDRTTPVLIAPAGMAILGVHALEMLGLKVNPLGQLKKEPMLFAPVLSEHRYTKLEKRLASGLHNPEGKHAAAVMCSVEKAVQKHGSEAAHALALRGHIRAQTKPITSTEFNSALKIMSHAQTIPRHGEAEMLSEPSCSQKWVNYVKHGEPVGECGETPCPVSDKTFAIGLKSGSRYEFQYKLVEADKLRVSHDPMTFVPNPNYPQELQPRDRTRAEDQAQVIIYAAKPTEQQPVNKFAVCRASVSGKVCGS